MKKAMKQSTLILLLNTASTILILAVILLLTASFARNRQVDELNAENHELSEYATRFMIASTYLTGEARGYAATGDKAHYNNYMAELNDRKNREISMEKMNGIGLSSDEAQVLNRMMEISNELVPQEVAAMQIADKGDYLSAAKALLTAPYNNNVTELGTLKTELLDKITQRTRQEVDAMIVLTRVLEFVTFICAIGVIVLQCVAYLVVRKRVILPIAEVSSGMRSIADGDLTTHIALQADTSEIGMLVDSIHTMQTELQRYVSDISKKLTHVAAKDLNVAIDLEYIGDFKPIQESLAKSVNELNIVFQTFCLTAQHVAAGSEQVASSAQNVSDGAIHQATAIHEILGTVEEFDQRINDTAGQARMAYDLATQAGVELSHSNQQLQGMLLAMQEISDASGEIGKIIKTIEDIAFQTNILALNAAVEAARAGAAGKGFAVVADEVRNLATKSADASKTTSKMIENSLTTIQNGVKIAKLASETFVHVTENASKAANAMGTISQEAAEQVKEVTEIRCAIDKINDIVQHNTAAAEQQASASEEISEETNHFKDMVLQFKLRPQQTSVSHMSKA